MPFDYFIMVCCVFLCTHKASLLNIMMKYVYPHFGIFDMPTTPPKNIPNTQNLVYMMYIGFGFPPWPLYCFYDMLLVFPQTNVQLAIIIWCVCCVGALPSSAHTTIPSDLRLIYMPRRSASLFPVNEPFLLLIVVS